LLLGDERGIKITMLDELRQGDRETRGQGA